MTDHPPIPAPDGVTSSVQRSGDTVVLRLEWHNLRVRHDRVLVAFYFLFWLAFAAAAVWVTYGILFEQFEEHREGDLPAWLAWTCMGIFLAGAWAIALGMPYHLLGLSWSEWIEISGNTVSHGQTGVFAPRASSHAVENVRELFLGHCGEPGDRASFLTLNLVTADGSETWGDWLAPDLKVQLFVLIEQFVAKHKISLPMRLDNPNLRPRVRAGSVSDGFI